MMYQDSHNIGYKIIKMEKILCNSEVELSIVEHEKIGWGMVKENRGSIGSKAGDNKLTIQLS